MDKNDEDSGWRSIRGMGWWDDPHEFERFIPGQYLGPDFITFDQEFVRVDATDEAIGLRFVRRKLMVERLVEGLREVTGAEGGG